MAEAATRHRRSQWQLIAAHKLRWSIHAGGDGPYVVLSRCKAGRRRWCYWLYQTEVEAAKALDIVDSHGCTDGCQGKAHHSSWRLWPWDRPVKPRKVSTPTLSLPHGVDASEIDWS